MSNAAKELMSNPSLNAGKKCQYESLLSDHLAQLEQRLHARMQRQEDLLKQIYDQMSMHADLPRNVALPESEAESRNVARLERGPSLYSTDNPEEESK